MSKHCRGGRTANTALTLDELSLKWELRPNMVSTVRYKKNPSAWAGSRWTNGSWVPPTRQEIQSLLLALPPVNRRRRPPFNMAARAGEPRCVFNKPLKPLIVCLPKQIKGLSLKIEACHLPAYLNSPELPGSAALLANSARRWHSAWTLKWLGKHWGRD